MGREVTVKMGRVYAEGFWVVRREGVDISIVSLSHLNRIEKHIEQRRPENGNHTTSFILPPIRISGI